MQVEPMEPRVLFSADLNPFLFEVPGIAAQMPPVAEVRLLNTPSVAISLPPDLASSVSDGGRSSLLNSSRRKATIAHRNGLMHRCR